MVNDAFNTSVVVYNLHKQVTFPIHHSESFSDPVLKDLPDHSIQCFPLDFIGTSDHVTLPTKIEFRKPRKESFTNILWRWEVVNRDALLTNLRTTE